MEKCSTEFVVLIVELLSTQDGDSDVRSARGNAIESVRTSRCHRIHRPHITDRNGQTTELSLYEVDPEILAKDLENLANAFLLNLGDRVSKHSILGVLTVVLLEIVGNVGDANQAVSDTNNVILHRNISVSRFVAGTWQVDLKRLPIVGNLGGDDGALRGFRNTGNGGIESNERITSEEYILAVNNREDSNVCVDDRVADQLRHGGRRERRTKEDRFVACCYPLRTGHRIFKFQSLSGALVVENRDRLTIDKLASTTANS